MVQYPSDTSVTVSISVSNPLVPGAVAQTAREVHRQQLLYLVTRLVFWLQARSGHYAQVYKDLDVDVFLYLVSINIYIYPLCCLFPSVVHPPENIINRDAVVLQ